MAGRVEGKVAFITGAARGQGRAHAVRLAEEGADVVIVDICAEVPGTIYPASTSADLAETAEMVQARGRRVVSAAVDVRDFAGLRAAVDEGVARLGRLDIVCANAGVNLGMIPTHLIAEETWQDMIDINLTGVWHTVKATVPHLIEGGRGGSLVLTSSVAGIKAFANCANYVAAKHGVVGLMKTLAVELGPESIRVNAVLPGSVDTPMIQNEATWKVFRPDLERPTKEDFANSYQSLNALPAPWADPSEISSAVLFLASDESRFITGVALPIDGGFAVK